MSDSSSDESLRDLAKTLRQQKEANARECRLEQERLNRFRSAVEAQGDAVRTLLWATDPLSIPPSVTELDGHCNRVTLALAGTLAALREADLRNKLEQVNATATLAHYRQKDDDPKEVSLVFQYAWQIIAADPDDRQRLAHWVRGAVEEPGLRRAWQWVSSLLKGLAGEQKLAWKEVERTTEPGPPSPPANPATAQEEGRRESDEHEHEARPETTRKEAPAAGRSLHVRPRFEEWALAMEHGRAWHLFKKYGPHWRHQGKAQGISQGRQAELLRGFAEGGGLLAEEKAVKSVRPTFSKDDRRRILKILKPAISRLRKVIRQNLRVTDNRMDPLPWDKHSRGWQAAIQTGYAVLNDEDRLEFKLAEQLSRDETLDVGG